MKKQVEVGDFVFVLPKRNIRSDFVARIGKVTYIPVPHLVDLTDLENDAPMMSVPRDSVLFVDMSEWKGYSYRYIRGAILINLYREVDNER